jgi:two-component system, sensor histidine kinase ChiS
MSKSAIHLLVIDDEPLVLKVVKSVLTQKNYKVTTCEKSLNGLKLMSKKSFDCVITDILMPNLSGYELVKSIRKNPKYATLPILMLTRKRNREDIKKAVDAGATDYILKPIDEALFLEKVELCLRKKNKHDDV